MVVTQVVYNLMSFSEPLSYAGRKRLQKINDKDSRFSQRDVVAQYDDMLFPACLGEEKGLK